jgi:hypothetical protein
MKKSLLAAMAACALLATTATATYAAPQTNTLELKGTSASAVIGGGGSGGMTAKSADQFNATNFGAATGKGHTNFKANKTSPYPVGLGFENGTPFKNVPLDNRLALGTDKAVGKKSDLVINAPAPNMLTNDVAVIIDQAKNGSSDTVVGTGAQFTLTAASRSPAQSRST